MSVKELTGSDIVKIINAASKAKVKKVTVGDLELLFEGFIEQMPSAPMVTTSGWAFSESQLEPEPTIQLPTEEELEEMEMAQLAITNPGAWEDRQLNPEKYQE